MCNTARVADIAPVQQRVFGARMLLATLLSLCGAVVIAVDPAYAEAFIGGCSGAYSRLPPPAGTRPEPSARGFSARPQLLAEPLPQKGKGGCRFTLLQITSNT